MMVFLEFALGGGFWRFVGVLILMSVAVQGLAFVAAIGCRCLRRT